MGGPEMAPQTPQALGASRVPRDAPRVHLVLWRRSSPALAFEGLFELGA